MKDQWLMVFGWYTVGIFPLKIQIQLSDIVSMALQVVDGLSSKKHYLII